MPATPLEHRLIVDRVEGDHVVVEMESAGTLDLPRWMLPDELREGDVLVARAATADGERRVVFSVDPAATEARREEAAERVHRLRSRDPGGDITL